MSIETVRTLNSTYEIDHDGKRIRRTRGSNPVTEYQREDGVWQEYQQIVDQPNGCLLILWDERRGTLTSKVVERS